MHVCVEIKFTWNLIDYYYKVFCPFRISHEFIFDTYFVYPGWDGRAFVPFHNNNLMYNI